MEATGHRHHLRHPVQEEADGEAQGAGESLSTEPGRGVEEGQGEKTGQGVGTVCHSRTERYPMRWSGGGDRMQVVLWVEGSLCLCLAGR